MIRHLRSLLPDLTDELKAPGLHERKIASHFGGRVRIEPGGEPLPLRLVLIGFTNRCGSNHLMECLTQTGRVGGGREPLNHDIVARSAAEKGIESFEAYLRHLARQQCKGDRPVWALKASSDQILMLFRWGITHLVEEVRILHISRRNIIDQAVSMLIASQTEQWASFQTSTGAEPVFDAQKLSDICESFQRHNGLIAYSANILDLPYTHVTYEDLTRRRARVIRNLGHWMGEDLSGFKLTGPRFRKQSSALNTAFIARYRDIAAERILGPMPASRQTPAPKPAPGAKSAPASKSTPAPKPTPAPTDPSAKLLEALASHDAPRANFDYVQPRLEYNILFTARCGSGYLKEVLTGAKLGEPREWFNPAFATGHARSTGARTVEEYVARVKSVATRKGNGIFGHEMTMGFHQVFSRHVQLDFYIDFSALTVILFRRDILYQAISLYLAVERSHYHSTDGAGALPTIAYDGDKIAHWLEHLARQEQAIIPFVERHQPPLRFLDYDRIVTADRDRLAESFGMALGEAAHPVGNLATQEKLGDGLNDTFHAQFRAQFPGRLEAAQARRGFFFDGLARAPLLAP